MMLLIVAAGGASGAVLRVLASAAVGVQHVFPWATLVINIAGSFAIGLVWGLYGHQEWFQSWGRLFLVVGLLGGFTTFSAFSFETLNLIENGRLGIAGAYAALSVGLCLGAVWLGTKAG